jgi:hypothetical protein
MKRWMMSILAALVAVLSPLMALAEGRDPETIDPRTENYPKTVMFMEAKSTALTWLLLIFLMLLAIAVLFKNARRTHLD